MMMAGTRQEGANEENCLLWEPVSQTGSHKQYDRLICTRVMVTTNCMHDDNDHYDDHHDHVDLEDDDDHRHHQDHDDKGPNVVC